MYGDDILSITIGIGWSSQDLVGDDTISFVISVSETGLNAVQGWRTTGKSIL